MRNLYEQCLKLTQFAAMEFEEIFQFSQESQAGVRNRVD